jgi:hypothetical protein
MPLFDSKRGHPEEARPSRRSAAIPKKRGHPEEARPSRIGVGRPKSHDSEGWGGCSGSEATGVPIDRPLSYRQGMGRAAVEKKVI